jgi:hypothetical protein
MDLDSAKFHIFILSYFHNIPYLCCENIPRKQKAVSVPMDTRYWGPSGWELLHLIAASKKDTYEFWKTIPFILPCKFCRASLSQYYEENPIPKEQNRETWLWMIHNLVNAKLRGQGQTVAPDPPFEEVRDMYRERLKQGCTKTRFPGWKFLFSIADNHPNTSPSKPMPDVTEEELCNVQKMSLEENNRKNLLTPKERIQALTDFWKQIPDSLPFEEWQTSFKKHARSLKNVLQTRKTALEWLWKIRCGVDGDLEDLSKKSFYGLCKEVAQHRSGCAKSKRARTCRKIRHSSTKKKGKD